MKAERFDIFMEVQNKKMKLNQMKIVVKAASEEQTLLFVKATDLYPDATKFVQDFHACTNFLHKRRAKKNQNTRYLARTTRLGVFDYLKWSN